MNWGLFPVIVIAVITAASRVDADTMYEILYDVQGIKYLLMQEKTILGKFIH